ncbi:MAG: GxxExxY protein [Bacteroidota bacterium]|nr:GxxExxY protein [Bacteroidota bacterium]
MMKYDDISRKIIASAMKVHTALGNGFQEVIYQKALEIEMPYENLLFQREMEIPIFYREQYIEKRRVDFHSINPHNSSNALVSTLPKAICFILILYIFTLWNPHWKSNG